MVRASSISLLAVLGAVIAAPVEPRQDLDCSPGAKTGLKAGCFAQLKVGDYVKEWVKANGTAANCDKLGFAQCFLAFNGFAGLTCDLITSNTCPPFDTDDKKYESPQQFYTLWNIYTVYQFFNQYSQALSNGASLAGQTIGDIVAKVAPPVEAQAKTSELESIFGATMGVVTSVAGLIPGDSGVVSGLILNGLSTAFGLKPLLGETLLPTQTANERFVQLGQIGSSLASLIEGYQNNLLKAVQTIQKDTDLFLAATGQGGFSERVTTSLTVQSSQLYRQLQLFVLSQALAANGIVSSRTTGADPREVAKNTGQITCDSFTGAGNCFQWFFDDKAKNTYALHNPNDWTNTQIDLTNAIVDNGWASLADVFKVENCQGKGVAFDPKSVGVTCLASHKFCEWNPKTSRADPQWTNCDNDSKWGTLCGSFTPSILVPESYMGSLLSNEQLFCKRL